MAYRQIHTKIWKDAWFLELGAEAKLLFLYLCTNERTNILGLYDLPLKVAAFETDLPLESIKSHLASFQQDGKVEYENGWVWVRNLMRYNAANLTSEKVRVHITNTLALLPDGRLKTACMAYNTVCIPSAYPMDTVAVTEAEAEQEQEQKQEQEAEQQQQPARTGAIAPVAAAAFDLPVGEDDAIEIEDSRALLADIGIGEPNLTKYAEYPAAVVSGWIIEGRRRQRENSNSVHNLPGWVIKMLLSGTSPPKPKPDDGDWRRFLEGPYAAYIEH